jgi:hypothetical protein
MKTYGIILILITVALFGLPAYTLADGWEQYFTNAGGDKFYYDGQTISKIPPSTLRVRIKGLPAREATMIAGFEQVLELDCQKRISRKIESKITRPDGTVQTQVESADWSQVQPGSSTGILLEKLCKTTRRFER